MPGTWNTGSTKTNKMLWSLVPTETTDWKLGVDILPSKCDFDQTNRNEQKKQKRTQTYYVHKNILAEGNEYFFPLFNSRIGGQAQYKELQLGASSISFPESVAAAMPVFLNYIYDMKNDSISSNNGKWSGSGKRRIFARKEAAEHPYGSDEDEDLEKEPVVDEHMKKVSNVVRNSPELYFLGDYFGVPSLKNYTLETLSKSVKTIDDAFTIYTKAESLGLACEDVCCMILNIIAGNLSTIKPADEIVQNAPLIFWLKLAKSVASNCCDGRDTDWEADALHWSKLVVQVIENNPESMTPSAFQELTSTESLPIVSHCTVSQLMKFDEKFRPKNPSSATHNHHDELSLYSRCAKAIAECHYILSVEQASSMLTKYTHDFIAKVLFYQSRNVAEYKTELGCAVKVVSRFLPVPRGAKVLTQTPRNRVSPSTEIVRYHDTLTESTAVQRFLNNEEQQSVYFYNGR